MAASASYHDNRAFAPGEGDTLPRPRPSPSPSASTRSQGAQSFISSSFHYLAEARGGAGYEEDSDDEGGQKVDDSIFDDISLGGATPRGSTGAAARQLSAAAAGGGDRLAALLRALVLGGAAMTTLVGQRGSVSVQGLLLGDSPLVVATGLAQLLAGVLAALLAVAPALRLLGVKWTFAVSILLYAPYCAAQFVPCYYTLLPAAALGGVGASLGWCSRGVYLCQLAYMHASHTNSPLHLSLVKCFSAFYAVFNLSEFWDSLITTMAIPPMRATWFPCNGNESDVGYERTTPHEVHILNGVYVSLVLVAFLMAAIGLSSLQWCDKAPRTIEERGSLECGLFTVSVTGLRECKQVLLAVPMLLFLGVHRAYFLDEYIENYVSCELGLDYVVNAMMCLGATSSVAALITAGLAAHVDSLVTTAMSVLASMAALITLLAWQLHQSDGYVVYVLAVLGGTATAILNIQVNVLCGMLVPGHEVEAFSHVALWHSLSHLLATAASSYLAPPAKLCIMVVLLGTGSAAFVFAELARRRA